MLWYHPSCPPCLSFHTALSWLVLLTHTPTAGALCMQGTHTARADESWWAGRRGQPAVLILQALLIAWGCYGKNDFAAPSNIAHGRGMWHFSANMELFGQLYTLPNWLLRSAQQEAQNLGCWDHANYKDVLLLIKAAFSALLEFPLDFWSPPTLFWALGRCSHCLLLISLAYMMVAVLWAVPEQKHLWWMGHEMGWNLWGILLQITSPSAMFCQRHSAVLCKYMLFHVTVVWKQFLWMEQNRKKICLRTGLS